MVSGVKSTFRADFVLLILVSGVKSMFWTVFVLLTLVSGVKSTFRADFVLLVFVKIICSFAKVIANALSCTKPLQVILTVVSEATFKAPQRDKS